MSVSDSFFRNYISIDLLSFIVLNSQSQRLFIYRYVATPEKPSKHGRDQQRELCFMPHTIVGLRLSVVGRTTR